MKGRMPVVVLVVVIILALGLIVGFATHKSKPAVTDATGGSGGGGQVSTQPAGAD